MDMIKISKIENVRMLDRFNEKKHSVGSLFLTTTHLIFNDPERRRETWLLHMHIQSMEKQALTTSGCPLVVRSKNFLSVTFLIPAERQCHDIYQSLLQLSQSVCTSIKQAVRQSELFSLVYQCTYTNYTASTIRHAAKIYPRHSGGTSSRLRKSSNDRECLISSGSKATLIQTIRSDYSDSKSYSQLRVTSFLPTDCH
ncbi:myotubularin-related protein 6-like isoform X5 [Varroa destructor]|uniref:MTMR6-9 GRAM domain-containing protein n=1 Tax=Varroa destructor TaxID=109461 RepID=A0A7M7MBF5_VARDE|nr:myotubularin-related protein 6-like isoform X5 [Varroa destructor]